MSLLSHSADTVGTVRSREIDGHFVSTFIQLVVRLLVNRRLRISFSPLGTVLASGEATKEG